MLPRVRFNLRRSGKGGTSSIAVEERYPAFRLFPPRFAKPRIEGRAQRFHHRPGGSGFRLDQVDILGVAGGRFQVQFVQRRPATEGKGFMQDRLRKDGHQRAANNEVLLNLEVLHPGCVAAPFRDEVTRNHNWSSTSVLT